MADCFYHTGRPSVIRCKQCGRPLCTECRMIKPEGIFCSQKCADSFKVFAQRAEDNEAKCCKSSGMNSFVKFLIFLAVLFIIYVIAKRLI